MLFRSPNTSSPGGRALKHACSVMIEMAPVGGSLEQDEDGVTIGHKVRATVRKNKVGKPFGKTEYSIQYTKGMVKTAEELVDLAVKYNIVDRPNNVTYEFMGDKFRGRAACTEGLIDFGLEKIEETIRTHYLDKERISLISDDDDEDGVEMENPLLGDLDVG